MPNNTNITYAYDADGRRVKQTVGSTVTNYQWDEASPYGDVVNEYNSSGSTLASYVLGSTGLISQTRGTTTRYFLQDGQGSTRALINSTTGAITDTYSYSAFGESFATTGTTVNPYRYTGQQLDTSTGLYNLRARYYNPALGRFLSQDTYPVSFGNPIEFNRYTYTANNPINTMDPTGQFAESAGTYIPSAQNIARIATIGVIVAFVIGAVVIGAIHQLVGTQERTMTWEEILALEERESQLAPRGNPKTNPTVYPPLPTVSIPTPDDDDDECDSQKFVDWWFTLPRVPESFQPDQAWYDYEQRVARGSGAYGNYTRTIPDGPIDADGIEPSLCYLVDAKFAVNPNSPQYRLDGPPWIDNESNDTGSLLDELQRYKNAIDNSIPEGLVIRTNARRSVPFFMQLLQRAGFTLNKNGFVQYVP